MKFQELTMNGFKVTGGVKKRDKRTSQTQYATPTFSRGNDQEMTQLNTISHHMSDVKKNNRPTF